VGSIPFGICFDGTNIWVTNNSNSTVTKLRASDGSIQGTYPVIIPYGICFDGANIWVSTDGTVTKLMASDGATLDTYGVGVGSIPNSICFDGNNIWVTNRSSSTVTKIQVNP